jgi:type I restriction enzyme S subunit
MRIGAPVPFSVAFADATGGNAKIQRKDFLPNGLLPVIDQGQDEVAGYTNDMSCAYSGDLPVVLFGDHTRTFKYVDRPFALGADGVKVLAPQPGFSAKFLYYYLLSCDIPSRGYSRHFKFLKELAIPLFAPSEQSRIVELLDDADRVRHLRREADAKVGRVMPALFLNMFGDPATNPMGWQVRPLKLVADTSSGGTPNTKEEHYYGGSIPWVKSGELSQREVTATEETISEAGLQNSSAKWVEPNSVLVAMYGATVGQVSMLKIRATTNQAICAIRAREGLRSRYLVEFLRLSKSLLLSKRVGGAQPNISQQIIRDMEIILPPDGLQAVFSERAEHLEVVLSHVAIAASRVEKLFGRMLASAFLGELTTKWREGRIKELLIEMEHQVRALNLKLPAALEVLP